jgi:hypothetical protein
VKLNRCRAKGQTQKQDSVRRRPLSVDNRPTAHAISAYPGKPRRQTPYVYSLPAVAVSHRIVDVSELHISALSLPSNTPALV